MKIKKHDATIPEMDMTPMIDMVFQLIAFFMVITNFDQSKADERVKLPEHQLARPPKVAREHEMILNVGYIRNKEGVIESGPWAFFNSRNYPIEAMAQNLTLEARVYSDKQVPLDDVSVVIRSDAEVPTGVIQELIKVAQEAGFQKFALKAKQQTD